MKKLKLLMTAVATAALSLSLTGCDSDPWDHDHYNWRDPYAWYGDYGGSSWGWSDNSWNDNKQDSEDNTLLEMAQTLCGEWEGEMDYSYLNDDGDSRTTEVFLANMKFFQYNNSQNALSGNGVETDYEIDSNGNTTGNTKTLEFSWYIEDNGDIYIKYTGSGATFVMDYGSSQTGFHLGAENGKNADTFYGYMIGTGSVKGDVIYINLERKNQVSSRSAAKTSAAFGKGFTFQPLKGTNYKLNSRR